MEQPTRFIGMDVHKDTIVVAVTAAGDVGKAVLYGTHSLTLPRRWRSWLGVCAKLAAVH